jgi:hypothetical protein
MPEMNLGIKNVPRGTFWAQAWNILEYGPSPPAPLPGGEGSLFGLMGGT